MHRQLLLVTVGLAACAVALVLGLVKGPAPDGANAASHREAPLISYDPAEDISDFFFFRSYESGNADKLVMIMNVNPMSEPSAGPNYYNFDPNATYTFNVDNDQDGAADVKFDFNFSSELRGATSALKLPLSYSALNESAGVQQITSLDSPGLGLRQKYTVRMDARPGRAVGRPGLLAGDLIAVPSNVGPLTMPNYPALAQQGTYRAGTSNSGGLPDGVSVFAGQRQDPFYIDLGGAFDTLNFGRAVPALMPSEDANDSANAFGVDMLSGFNVSTIALEVPISMIAPGGGVVGAYGSVSKFVTPVQGAGSGRGVGTFAQTNRLANPLINELVIGTVDKDRWNSLTPDQDGQFAQYGLSPLFATALQIRFGLAPACVPILVAPGQSCSASNRQDLANALLRYTPGGPLTGDWLRLNVTTPPTPLARQKRMGILASPADPAAWPNGRRPRDDVTDIATRVVGGPAAIAALAGDGINVDDAALPSGFPFLANPSDGRNRVHLNRS